MCAVRHLASRGLTVIAPNVRGSTGYGRTYQSLDDVELRMGAYPKVADFLERHLTRDLT